MPGHLLARHIDDFLADLANANKPRNTIRAYRGDLIAFAAHHDGDIARLTAAPVRAFLGGVAGQAPATETTQVYTLLADQVADTEIRAARRKRETRRR